jgi:hypothetical protein
VAFARVPGEVTRNLGAYEVPAVRLTRLAVSTAFQGRRIGAALLFAAGQRALSVAADVGGAALAAGAKDARAAGG